MVLETVGDEFISLIVHTHTATERRHKQSVYFIKRMNASITTTITKLLGGLLAKLRHFCFSFTFLTLNQA